LKQILSTTNSFPEVKTFSLFLSFFVTAEKVGEVGGDCCSGFANKGLDIFVV